MANRYRLLSDFSVEDIATGKRFNPLKDSNRKQAEKMAEGGDYDLLEVINQLELDGNSYQSRMAADINISDLLKSLEGDVALEKAVADAKAYIDLRAPQLQQLGVTKGASSLGEASKRIADLGKLQGNVPMPLISQTPYGERRIHTDYEMNDITGEQQVVGYMDPSKPTQVLKTLFGPMQSGQQGDYDFASEYVGNQALKLAGVPGVVNNDVVNYRADLRDPTVPMGTGNIDVERGLSREDEFTLPVQLTAKLQPTQRGGGLSAIDQYMRNNPNVGNLVDAIRGIKDSQFARNTPDTYYYGKGFKSIKGLPEDRINKVLSLEYDRTMRDDKNFNGYVGVARAPKDINLVNLSAGMQILEDVGRNIKQRPGPNDVRIHSIDYETDAGGRFDPRSKVKANIPKGMVSSKGDVFSTNMLVDSPLTQQLLDASVLRQRMV